MEVREKCRVAIADVITSVDDTPKKKASFIEAFRHLLVEIDGMEEENEKIDLSEFERLKEYAINLTQENDSIIAQNIELKKALEEIEKSDAIAIEDVPEDEIDKMINDIEKPKKKTKKAQSK